MIRLLCFVLAMLASPFKSKSRLEAENAVLRHQLIDLRRRVRGRAQPTNNDRWFLVQMYRWFPSILTVVTIVQPETLVRWHRAGFRRYWRWKSNSRGGRPPIENELRALIRQMSTENQLWGAPRIHGELLKLGFSVAQSSVAKYMVKRCRPPSQGWKTFLRNHAPDIAYLGFQRRSACSARSLHPKLLYRKNFIPRTDIIQNYRVGGCQTLNLRLVLCRKDRQPPPTFGIIYRTVTHDRTNFGETLKVVAVSLHDVAFAVGHRLYEVRARQDHFAQEVGHLLPAKARRRHYADRII